jgi:hypothetical protein
MIYAATAAGAAATVASFTVGTSTLNPKP